MVPTLIPGDLVRVEPTRTPARGDVVTFSLGGDVVTHRVVKVTRDSIVCRGDNRRAPDPPVPLAELIGRVVEVAGKGPLRGGRGGLWSASARQLARRLRARL
jgi:phage repressor protein C with HTH and peptisase S24 domain